MKYNIKNKRISHNRLTIDEVRKGIENNLEHTKKLDKLKDHLCNLNGVKLVRVPYFLKDKDFYDKIIDGLKLIYKDDYYKTIKRLEIENNTLRQAARELL